MLIIILLVSNCSEDDGVTTIDPNNNAPNTFDLISIANNSSEIDLDQITFTWEATTDPDGDSIIYEVYFGTDPTNIDILLHATSTTSYIFDGRFNMCTTYYWKVIAKDNNGGETQSDTVFNFTTRNIHITNSALVQNASFPIRARHQTIVYDNRMWLIAGTTKDGVTNNFIPYNDVYSTLDGINWEEITNEASFSKRYGHASVTFDNKMWVIGGNDGQFKNDVWSSTDGWNWTQETASASFPPMQHHKAVVYNNKIWIFHNDDVWNTDDGVNWTQINSQANFMPRTGYSVTVFKNEIWLIAGRTSVEDLKNDVWKTSDGITWVLVTAMAPFSPRLHHAATVFDESLYIIGGLEQPVLDETNDVWKTNDGNTWTQVSNNAFFEERLFHTAISYNDKLWVIAGAEDIISAQGFNDVWVMD
jgi:hypothetical protein